MNAETLVPMRIGYRDAKPEDRGYIISRVARARHLRVKEAEAVVNASRARVAVDIDSGALVGCALDHGLVVVDREFRGQGIEERLGGKSWQGS